MLHVGLNAAAWCKKVVGPHLLRVVRAEPNHRRERCWFRADEGSAFCSVRVRALGSRAGGCCCCNVRGCASLLPSKMLSVAISPRLLSDDSRKGKSNSPRLSRCVPVDLCSFPEAGACTVKPVPGHVEERCFPASHLAGVPGGQKAARRGAALQGIAIIFHCVHFFALQTALIAPG